MVAQLRGADFWHDPETDTVLMVPTDDSREIANDALDDVAMWLGFVDAYGAPEHTEYLNRLDADGERVFESAKG